jgi:hypothetical protein
MLELSGQFARIEPDRTDRFVAFANEVFFDAPDTDSRRFAELAKKRRDRILAMISRETTGYFSNERGTQR